MKTIYSLLAVLLILPPIWAADAISVEEFTRMNISDQEKAIEQAPPEMKKTFEKILNHQALLLEKGGEAGLQTTRESFVIQARGLVYLEGVFGAQSQVWDYYVGAVLAANAKAGMTREKQAEEEKRLIEERDAIQKRLQIVHSLVLHLAASPKALELEKRAEKLDNDLSKRLGLDGSTPYQPITKDERMKVDKQLDQIFEALKNLPTLTPDQVKKEYDAFPEENIPHNK